MQADVTADYLVRLGLVGVPSAELASLERLQRAHLTMVPFENLDVFAGRDVRTDLDWSLPKIVTRRRGGWCFELNGAFASLLASLGFDVALRGATVLLPPTATEASHLTLEVRLDRPYLIDVGFGDSFISPLALDVDVPQDGGSGMFRIAVDAGAQTLLRRDRDGYFEPQYRIEPGAWSLSAFDDASRRLRTDPELSWTKDRFATRLLSGGPDRVTLLEDRIKFRRGREWTESAVPPETWDDTLDECFELTS